MASRQDAEFRKGLAGCLGSLGAILLAVCFEVAAPLFGVPGVGGGLAFLGLGIAVAGALGGIVSVIQMERAASMAP